MYTFNSITLEEALEKEKKGTLYIFDLGNRNEKSYHPKMKVWKSNFEELQIKARHIPPHQVPEYFNCEYLIIHSLGCVDNESKSFEWKYLYGKIIDKKKEKLPSSTEYVYCLDNKKYPDLLKIGMTRKDPVKRLKEINGTGTVSTWKLFASLPVKRGSASGIEHSIHKKFNSRRYHAINPGDREMFYITKMEALDALREYGEFNQIGEIIFY